ncbi:multicopper oxidase domain-containing protein [Streptomyces sp. NBC_00370]|uniref:multicopper oxidase domain-containing protein n=1 Tax=Streptomyces sp. NBC_00370 TaxID=2975728 RepID=UPI002E26A42B
MSSTRGASTRARVSGRWRSGGSPPTRTTPCTSISPFQVVSRNGGPPDPTDHGWKDTINLRPKQYADVAIRFDDYAGRYLLHCHNLEHEDMAMMATFRTGR